MGWNRGGRYGKDHEWWQRYRELPPKQLRQTVGGRLIRHHKRDELTLAVFLVKHDFGAIHAFESSQGCLNFRHFDPLAIDLRHPVLAAENDKNTIRGASCDISRAENARARIGRVGLKASWDQTPVGPLFRAL
jgi:hypothetical protein